MPRKRAAPSASVGCAPSVCKEIPWIPEGNEARHENMDSNREQRFKGFEKETRGEEMTGYAWSQKYRAFNCVVGKVEEIEVANGLMTFLNFHFGVKTELRYAFSVPFQFMSNVSLSARKPIIRHAAIVWFSLTSLTCQVGNDFPAGASVFKSSKLANTV